jgi:Zn-dependent protease
MFGVAVRVHPMFWLFTALLGWGWYTLRGGNIVYLLLWVLAAFVSILVHEFGHVLMGWAFGSRGHIVLYSFGGLAVGSTQLARRWQRIVVLLAGPAAQFVLLGLVWAYVYLWPPPIPTRRDDPEYLAIFLLQLELINLFWPVLNLVPIYPLDGGQVSMEICQAVSPQRGTGFALGLSMVLAGVLAVHFLLGPNSPIPYFRFSSSSMYGGIFFAWMCVNNFQLLQAETVRRRQWDDDRLPWER